jgi:integrase
MATKTSSLVQNYTAAAQSESTRRSYAQDMRHFKASGGRVPATPEIVAEYIAGMAGVYAVATIEHRLIAIHRAHVDKKKESPVQTILVRQVMQGIRRTHGAKQRQVRPLVRDTLTELLIHVAKYNPLRAARDKAILLVGFAGAFRRSELAALDVTDLTEYSHGIEIAILRSKTDQDGRESLTKFIPLAKSHDHCPVLALKKWLQLSGTASGPVFRQVNKHGSLRGTAALTPAAIALIVKKAVTKAKGTEAARAYSGHSMRSGFVTEAAGRLQLHEIMGQTAHRSLEMVQRYIRPVERRRIPSLL